MTVAREIKDMAFVAQSCYSLGNTFTLMQNYPKAIEFHTVHLQYAQQLEDRYIHVCLHPLLGSCYVYIRCHEWLYLNNDRMTSHHLATGYKSPVTSYRDVVVCTHSPLGRYVPSGRAYELATISPRGDITYLQSTNRQ